MEDTFVTSSSLYGLHAIAVPASPDPDAWATGTILAGSGQVYARACGKAAEGANAGAVATAWNSDSHDGRKCDAAGPDEVHDYACGRVESNVRAGCGGNPARDTAIAGGLPVWPPQIADNPHLDIKCDREAQRLRG